MTTAWAPMTAPSPMVTPRVTVALAPIHTSSPITHRSGAPALVEDRHAAGLEGVVVVADRDELADQAATRR